jgi:hypothetical protein
MKEIKINSVEEIIEALNNHNILYNENKTIKYWLYQGFILSAEVDNEQETAIISDIIEVGKNFYYFEV